MNQDIYLDNPQKQKFHFGHLKSVIFAVILLLAVSWFKDPGLFAFLSSAKEISSRPVASYIAYQEPNKTYDGPQVAGANTFAEGPALINEDGSITPLNSGKVLGASTAESFDASSLKLKFVEDEGANIEKYFSDTIDIEAGGLNSVEFESALASSDQNAMSIQAQKLENVYNQVLTLEVPKSFLTFHRQKLESYFYAIKLLKNYSLIDSQPEIVVEYMTKMMDSQTKVQQEYESLKIK